MITLTVRHSPSALDTRRGVVRLHPEVMDALGLRAWSAVQLTGARVTAALAAAADTSMPTGVILTDDITMSNLGLIEGAEVVVSPIQVAVARTVTVSGSKLASTALQPETVRLALMGKVLTTGDAVSLLPQDLAPPPEADVQTARNKLATAIGITWTNELLTITATEPAGAVVIQPSTVVSWRNGASTGGPISSQGRQLTSVAPIAKPEVVVPVADLIGSQTAARRLTEWFELSFQQPELLNKLGATARLGVLVAGPAGVGKATMVHSVANAIHAAVIELNGPSTAALEAATAAQRVQDTIGQAISTAESGTPCVLLIADVDALLPANDPPSLATVVLDMLQQAIRTPGLALVVTSAHPEVIHPRLRDPDLVDREITLALPDNRTRVELLRLLLREVPLAADVDLVTIAERTPGFVVADLVALRREAAVRAALRQQGESEPAVNQEDLVGASQSVRPISMSTSDNLAIGELTLDDVGDMTEVKQALTEAVLWPLRYPDSFARLGVQPPRGVLLYGPPGCGKTFLVRALAGSGNVNVLAVKGAELMDKWVGESERAVRDLFRRATQAAPTLIFLDEIDALAPRRGQSSDSGVADRVVAALLTELDGVEQLNDVVVIGATNRPELIDPALLRPGRLERLVFVPPPDETARTEILRSAARHTPLTADVDLAQLATELDGYSAADCAALIREAALTAMRESISATEVTPAHLTHARKSVRPSLDPVQLANLQSYANQHNNR